MSMISKSPVLLSAVEVLQVFVQVVNDGFQFKSVHLMRMQWSLLNVFDSDDWGFSLMLHLNCGKQWGFPREFDVTCLKKNST